MEKAASVFLRADINNHDTDYLLKWLGDDDITEYLSDDCDSVKELHRLKISVPPYLWQMCLNQNGRFFMVDIENIPAGFIRLSEIKDEVYEIVIVLGEKDFWGKGYGTAALKRCLSQAFFEHRAQKIVANIYSENTRSLRIFEKAKFCLYSKSTSLIRYHITRDQYIYC